MTRASICGQTIAPNESVMSARASRAGASPSAPPITKARSEHPASRSVASRSENHGEVRTLPRSSSAIIRAFSGMTRRHLFCLPPHARHQGSAQGCDLCVQNVSDSRRSARSRGPPSGGPRRRYERAFSLWWRRPVRRAPTSFPVGRTRALRGGRHGRSHRPYQSAPNRRHPCPRPWPARPVLA